MFRRTYRMFFYLFLILVGISLLVNSSAASDAYGSDGDISPLKAAALFFTNPVASTALLTIGFLGFFIELITMCSLAGGVGIAAMFLFFASYLILDPTKAWVAIVFVVGLVFLVAEIFFLPGHGMSGLIGLVCTYLSIFLIMPNATQAAISFVSSLLIAGLIFVVALKYLPKSPAWNKFRLQTVVSEEEGYVSSRKKKELEGAIGVALSDLRPSGIALIDETRVDVTTNGNFIKKDTPVKVVKIEGIRVVVEAVEQGW